MRKLYLSLKYRPKILRLLLKMRQCIKKKNQLIMKLKLQIKGKATEKRKISLKDESTQTDDSLSKNDTAVIDEKKTLEIETPKEQKRNDQSGTQEQLTEWNISKDNESALSLAEQVKEVAQNALQQSGMVYVESAGMYYDYKTGYYYNSELGLYYHTETGCYYYYSEEKQNFVFHSYPDQSKQASTTALEEHEKRKARKLKRNKKTEDDVDKLTKNLSQDKEDDENNEASRPKRRKTSKKKTIKNGLSADINKSKSATNCSENNDAKETNVLDKEDQNEKEDGKNNSLDDTKDGASKIELEDGECSETASEESEDEDASSAASTSAASDDESVARHHPPCMRVVVKETGLLKLRAGTLFLVTKDGGSLGREGDHHAILLKDHNVSRNHLNITYDMGRRTYVATDLGSKNGTILNGARMSESQVVSKAKDIIHGSVLEIGETKLLCHIHPGTDTCGHCEPGLIMENEEKEKKAAYTRTCSVQKQHQLELARLKNKYAPQPLAIEATAYNDRAQARRDQVGSSHHAEKTQASDIDTFIAPENKGFKLLEKMGWSKGEGLGKDNQGDAEPIPMVRNEGKAGLGTGGAGPPVEPVPLPRNKLGPATLRLATNTKMLKPPARAFQEDDDDDEPLE